MRPRRQDDADPEYTIRRAPEDHGSTPLFAGWPTSPQVTTHEQRGLALPESVESRYAAWRTTDDGEAAVQWVARAALAELAQGATRLFIDRLAWQYRSATRRPLNNTFRSLLARELVDTYPVLRQCFELRERRAS